MYWGFFWLRVRTQTISISHLTLNQWSAQHVWNPTSNKHSSCIPIAGSSGRFFLRSSLSSQRSRLWWSSSSCSLLAMWLETDCDSRTGLSAAPPGYSRSPSSSAVKVTQLHHKLAYWNTHIRDESGLYWLCLCKLHIVTLLYWFPSKHLVMVHRLFHHFRSFSFCTMRSKRRASVHLNLKASFLPAGFINMPPCSLSLAPPSAPPGAAQWAGWELKCNLPPRRPGQPRTRVVGQWMQSACWPSSTSQWLSSGPTLGWWSDGEEDFASDAAQQEELARIGPPACRPSWQCGAQAVTVATLPLCSSCCLWATILLPQQQYLQLQSFRLDDQRSSVSDEQKSLI